MWPTFISVTLLDGVLLNRLPPTGDRFSVIGGIIVSTFVNLVVIAVLAPWLARRVWKRRPAAEAGSPPRAQLEVLSDRMGTALLLATVAGLVVAGLASHPTIVSETEATERNAEAFRALIVQRGDKELIRNLETANTIRLGDDYFRTCVARDERDRYFCAFVDTSRHPPDVDVDGSAEPNSVYRVP